MASVEFRGAQVTLTRVRDPSDAGAVAGLKRFLTDRPLTLELGIPDAEDLSRLYEALAGAHGALRDLALTFGDAPPPPRRQSAGPPTLREPTRADARRRWKLRARDDLRSGALPLIYAGWVVALATLVGAAFGVTETTTGTTTTCSWDARGWLLPTLFVGPPIALLLIVTGTRRLRHEEFAPHGWLGGFLAVLLGLALYGGALLHTTGHALC